MKKLLIAISASFLLAACSTTTSISNLPTSPQLYQTYKINDVSNQNVDKRIRQIFMDTLKKRLTKLGYQQGDALSIDYNIQLYDQGNRALRYFVGFGAGKAETTILTIIKNKSGKNIGNIKTNADLKIGFFGGNAEQIIKNAAVDVANEIWKSDLLKNNKK